MFVAALLVACTSDDGNTDVALATGCVENCELELSAEVVCAAPGRTQHFTRQPSAATPRPAEALVASAGIVAADFTGDGVVDMFLPHEDGVSSQLYVGDVDEGAIRLAGIDLVGAVGGSAVDVEGDGDLDLFVTRWERNNVLLANDGTGHFDDVTAEAGLDTYLVYDPSVMLRGHTDRGLGWRHQSASWGDMDLDGDLDLYVGGYGIKPVGDQYCYNCDWLPPADPDELWVNDGDGTFTDRADLIDLEIHDAYTFMSSWFDTDGDSYPELFVWNDFGTSRPSRVLHNDGGLGFSYEDGVAGIDTAFEAMGVAVADLNGDRLPDFALSSYQKMLIVETSDLPSYAGPLWLQSQNLVPLGETQDYGWGAEFGDLDNDRDDDLVMGFGFWSQYTGPMDARLQPDGLWLRDETGAFPLDVAADPAWNVADPWITRGLVVADVDGNGFLDILKRTLDSPGVGAADGGPQGVRYLATCDESAWLEVALIQPDMNPHAIGARVTVTSPDGHEQTRWVTSGSTSMYSSGPAEVHFGLAQDAWVDVEVTWPDGDTSIAVEVPTRRKVHLIKGG